MKKVIEEGAFIAEVDATDINNVQIKIAMTAPLMLSDYRPDNSPWNWEKDIADEARYLRMEVNAFIQKVWEERQCAAS